MNILIADSQGWFKIKPGLSRKFNIKLIKDKSRIIRKYFKKFNPSYLFFAHWSWIVPARIYKKNILVLFSYSRLCLYKEEEAQYKI